jgi:toxin-antitoxin system PIN domain toxin
MILVDANLLLYAYDAQSPMHEKARRWLEDSFSRSEPFCFSWVTLTAFIRISTNLRVFHYPLSLVEAVRVVDEWLEQPNAVILNPGEHHWQIFSKYLKDSQATGPLATDAHLAALAVEHGATLGTNDRDFSRFEGLKVHFPLEAQ